MIRISPIAEDWVVKGFHLHVNSVEIVMRPAANGDIIFKPFFSSTFDTEADEAVRQAEELLEDVDWRRRLYSQALKARDYLKTSVPGALSQRAKGVSGEMHFLMVALKKLGIE